jgi:hypothetical protein
VTNGNVPENAVIKRAAQVMQASQNRFAKEHGYVQNGGDFLQRLAADVAAAGLLNERCGAEVERIQGFVRCDYIAGHGQAHSWFGDKQNWCTW